MSKWKKAADMDDLIKKIAKKAGLFPYEVDARADGTIVDRSRPGESIVIGYWTPHDPDDC